LAQGSAWKVNIKAGARTKYGKVSQLLRSVRNAGITNTAFLVDQRRLF